MPYAPCSTLKTVIFGYFGCDNLGDETNLKELVACLREFQPEIGITVVSAMPGKTAGRLGVESVGKYDWLGINRVFREADLLIGGGGSMLQDRSSIRSLIYYTGLIYLARRYRLDVFLYGQGIGPLVTWIGKQLARWALSQTKVITLRDQVSQSLLADLHATGPAIYLTAEPLLAKTPVPEPDVKQYWERIPTGRGKKLGLIPLEFKWFNFHFWIGVLAGLPREASEFYLIETAGEDFGLIHRLSKALGIPVLPVENCWESLQKAVGGMDLVVSARLHGLVAAVVQGTPCYGLAMDPKIEGFCIPIGVNFGRITSRTNPHSLGREILHEFKHGTSHKVSEPSRDLAKRKALRNQTVLKEVLMAIQGCET
jgi:polysaccharide pyruvyl transferase CsaB